MKIRIGFVSNSSSSSFICDVCGAEMSGWDMCLEEASMFECENGHVVCMTHALKEIPQLDDEDECIDDWNYSVKAEHCPVCNFHNVTSLDEAMYLRKRTKMTEKQVKEEITSKFKNYKAFRKYIDGGK